MIKRGYSDGPHGQIHWRMTGPKNGKYPDLYCLHPAPFSGLALTGIMPYLAQERRVIAPDFPGHGGSDTFRHDASIADYAAAISALLGQLSDGRAADIMGFHTGCLVAVELALSAPDDVNRLVLVDPPAFDPEIRREQLENSARPPQITTELESIAPLWERGMTRRIESQGIDRSFAMFAEQLRHGRALHGGFHAGFTYDVEDRLPRLAHSATIIATQSGLLDAARRAATLMPAARLVERLDIKRAVLDEAAEHTARSILEALQQ